MVESGDQCATDIINHNHWSYDILKKIAAEEQASQQIMEELKDIFAAEIDSIRRRESIRSIGDLIDCLERRDVLSDRNVDVLYEVADHCGSPRLRMALSGYVAPISTCYDSMEPFNQYQQLRLVESNLQRQLNINGTRTSTNSKNDIYSNSISPTLLPNPRSSTTSTTSFMSSSVAGIRFTDATRTKTYKLLSQEIGNYWRRFGRELGVGEGAMDEIEVQHPRDLSSRVYKLLHIFEADNDGNADDDKDVQEEQQLEVRLCRALDKSQRKDLRRKIESILLR